MRLHRFYINEIIGSKKELVIASPALANQIFRVFRMKKGDRVILFDGSGSDYECEITESGKTAARTVAFKVSSSMRSCYMPARKVYLCAAVVKNDNFELIVEKATELGVSEIFPILAERSEKKSLNEERLNKIATEASEQSGRGNLPVIHKIMRLGEALEYLRSRKVESVAFHTAGDSFSPEKFIDTRPIALFIGPEGGWSLAEIESFHNNKIAVKCLGPQVLRSETAVIAALSQVIFGVQ